MNFCVSDEIRQTNKTKQTTWILLNCHFHCKQVLRGQFVGISTIKTPPLRVFYCLDFSISNKKKNMIISILNFSIYPRPTKYTFSVDLFLLLYCVNISNKSWFSLRFGTFLAHYPSFHNFQNKRQIVVDLLFLSICIHLSIYLSSFYPCIFQSIFLCPIIVINFVVPADENIA